MAKYGKQGAKIRRRQSQNNRMCSHGINYRRWCKPCFEAEMEKVRGCNAKAT